MNKKLYFLTLLASFISGIFLSIIEFEPEYVTISIIFTILFAIPAYYHLFKSVPLKSALLILLFLSLFALFFESMAIKTSWPYGAFGYSDKIGPKVFDLVPITVAFSWPPLALAALQISQRFPKYALLAMPAALLVFDLILDPGATNLGFWTWEFKQGFYGVPWQNFFGWIVSGFLAALALTTTVKAKLNQNILLSTIFILTFWTAVAISFKFVIPALLGIATLITLHKWTFSKS